MVHSCLSCCINRAFPKCDLSKVGTYINNAASSLGNHYACRRLRGKEDTLDRCIKSLGVLLFGDIQGVTRTCPTSIVDQDIDPSKLGDCSRDECIDVSHVVDVRKNNNGPSAKGFNLTLELFDFL